MKNQINRRKFIICSAGLGMGSLMASPALTAFSNHIAGIPGTGYIPIVKKGEKQIFVDDAMIAYKSAIERRCHAAQKLDHQVLEGDKPWECFENEGVKIPYAGIYGTVLRDENSGQFRMWYNVYKETCYAESSDGINWQKPELGLVGQTNKINLFGFQSPSFILDAMEADPAKRYKAIGAKDGFSKEEIKRLKAKFKFSESYHRDFAYCAAYSADGLNWTMYPDPALMGMDTITLAQDPLSGEYMAFHKQTQDPLSFGRQVFLSTSKDMLTWSDTELAMATDEIDHEQARKLEGGTHSEIYNMSAFYYAGQWLGLITIFRCIGEPLVNGKAKAGQKGIIDVQLVHSRDGRKWQRCSDRSPVIPTGPYEYDKGMVFGTCNSPVIVGDEIWMYYSGSTDIHGGSSPNKKISIGRAVWRIDGMVSLCSRETEGIVETKTFRPQGEKLFVNADVSKGQLLVEVLDSEGNIVSCFEKDNCIPVNGASVCQAIKWKGKENLPTNKKIRLRFYMLRGNLYSFSIV